METLWERVRALKGRTLPTVSGQEFHVEDVDERYVRVVPRSSGTPRSPIPRWRFERAEALGLARTGVTPSEIRKAGVSEFDPAYIAAILRAAIDREAFE